MKKKNKGFTLVELLVVIAILAVLATVAVVGYTMFVKKANNSNALTELKQAENIVLSRAVSADGQVDEEIVCSGVEFQYSKALGKVIFDDGIMEIPVGSRINITNSMKREFSDLNNIHGYFIYEKSGKIYYITENLKGIALWESGKDPTNADLDVEDIMENVNYDDNEDIDVEDIIEEKDEDSVYVYFHLSDGSPDLGVAPNHIQVKKDTEIKLYKQYVEYNGIVRIIARSGVIAMYYTSPTHPDGDSGAIGSVNVGSEDVHIYIEYSN